MLTFDTHEYVESLEKSGFSPEQARTLAELQKKTFNEAIETEIATKSDINRLENRLTAQDGKLTLLQWMLAFVVVIEVIL